MAHDEKHTAQDEKQIQKRNRVTYMILSIVIAITAWALVAFANNPDISKTFHNLDVVIKGGDTLKSKELVVINEDEIRNLAVKVTGKRRDLIEAIDRIVVEVDVSDITEQGKYNLKGMVVLPTSRISVDKVKFSSVPVTVDVYTTVDIPVRITTSNASKDKLVKISPVTKTIPVSGAETELDRISEAVVDIDLSKIKKAGERSYKVRLLDGEGEEFDDLRTITKSAFKVNTEIYNYKELPVKPVLHESLKYAYEIDYDNTAVKPDSIGVGVLEGTEIKELTVVIDTVANEETEYKILEQDGLYIPSGSGTVSIKPEIVAAGTLENTAESEEK